MPPIATWDWVWDSISCLVPALQTRIQSLGGLHRYLEVREVDLGTGKPEMDIWVKAGYTLTPGLVWLYLGQHALKGDLYHRTHTWHASGVIVDGEQLAVFVREWFDENATVVDGVKKASMPPWLAPICGALLNSSDEKDPANVVKLQPYSVVTTTRIDNRQALAFTPMEVRFAIVGPVSVRWSYSVNYSPGAGKVGLNLSLSLSLSPNSISC